MPRLLALEWDEREVRVAVGRTSVGELTIDHAFAVERTDRPLEESLAEAFSERGIGRSETLVAVPRSRAELRLLSLPPVPDEDVPDLVRYQAMRQFSAMADDWLLDYVPLSGESEDQVQVLAAAVSPDVLQEVQSVCESGAWPARRIVLRPFASASLLNRRLPTENCRLLVELMNTEAELTMLAGREAVFIRSVRMPAENVAVSLAGEIRRTIAAAQNQMGHQNIESIVLCGDEEEYAALIADLAERLKQPIPAFDPFLGASLSNSLRDNLPPHRGRYASVLGMLYDEADNGRHTIDFLNPRRRPAPPNRRLQLALIAGGFVAAVVLLAIMFTWRLKSLDQRIEALRQQSATWDEQIAVAEELKADVLQVDKFVAGDITWLNELCYISQKFPPPEQAIVDQATFNSHLEGGGQMTLEGFVSAPPVIDTMESALRDEQHQVTGSGAQSDDRRTDYPWRFKERIDVPAPVIEEATIDE